MERLIIIPFISNPQFADLNESWEFKKEMGAFVEISQALLPIMLRVNFNSLTHRNLANQVLSQFQMITRSRDIENYGMLLTCMAMVRLIEVTFRF